MRYAWATVIHKWFVLVAGLRVGGVPFWRLLIHDLSKFTPSELPHYNRKFYGRNNDPLGFAMAWNHHESHNPHHWGYWIPRSGEYVGRPLPMPHSYVREMVADWMGASRAYTGNWDMRKWLAENLPRMDLHDDTRRYVYQVLVEVGYGDFESYLLRLQFEQTLVGEWRQLPSLPE